MEKSQIETTVKFDSILLRKAKFLLLFLLLLFFTVPFYLFLETALIAGFSWVKYGTEQTLFSTKLWHKLAQFSILFLIKLTGAQKREPSYTVGGNAN